MNPRPISHVLRHTFLVCAPVCLVLMALLARPAGASAILALEPPLQTVEEVLFTNGEVELWGQIYLPEGPGPFPAVVLMHGSGPDTAATYEPDARMLSAAGIAALAYDKRGTGQSAGDWRTASLDDLIGDALAGAELLRQHPAIDPQKVGLWGVSQGGWLQPFAAVTDPSLSFLVQVTSAAYPLANQELYDVGNDLHRRGFSDQAIGAAMKGNHLLYSARPLIQRGFLPLGDLWFVSYDPVRDPLDAWPNVAQPALLLFGAADALVPTAGSIARLEPILAETGHAADRLVVFANKPHALGGPPRNSDPAYTETVTAWIQAVTDGQEPPFGNSVAAAAESGDLRWYGMGDVPTPWYATVAVHLPLILLFLLTFLTGLILSMLPRFDLRLAGSGAWPRVALGIGSLTGLVLLAGFLYVLNYLLNAPASGAAPDVPFSTLLFILSLVMLGWAAALITFTWQAYRQESWTGLRRGIYAVVSGVAAGFVFFLGYWGLLGPPL